MFYNQLNLQTHGFARDLTLHSCSTASKHLDNLGTLPEL